MSVNKVTLQEVLAYREAYAPWFDLNEKLPFPVIKRNLSMLRRMGSLSGLTFDDFDTLSEKEIRSAIVAYNTPDHLAPKLTKIEQTPHTPAQFFHAMMSKSPYTSEIIPYLEPTQKQTAPAALSSHKETRTSSTSKYEAIHGLKIKEDEAFLSIRHYSADKKVYGKIIAKNGCFTAEHHGLNNEQKNDLALEMGLQFLLNLRPDQKEVYITGSQEEASRLYASLLLLQKESGARYADITIHVPEEISLSALETPDEYIKKHLGSIKKNPEQVTQLHEFLNIKPSALQLIDVQKILKTAEMSSTDKAKLTEYQTYLNEWAHEPPANGTGTEILLAQQRLFIEMTASVLSILKKTPSLSKEYEALKGLYEGELKDNKHMLDNLYKNEVDFERKRSDILAKLNDAKKVVIEEGINQLKNGFTVLKCASDTHLSSEQWKELDHHEAFLKDMEKFIQKTPRLSDAQIKSYSMKLTQIANVMEPFLQPVFKKEKIPFDMNTMKSSFESVSKPTQFRMQLQDIERLKQGSEHIVESFNRFKKEYGGVKDPIDAVVAINMKGKEQIKALASKAENFISENIEPEHEKINQLIKLLKKHVDVASINKESLSELKQCIEAAIPLLKDHTELTQTLSELSHNATPKSEDILEVIDDETTSKLPEMK